MYFIRKEALVTLAKFSFKIVKFMIFITFKSCNRKSLVSISSLEKNVEAVVQRCYVKINKARRKTPELEPLFNIVAGLRCFQMNFAKYCKNTFFKKSYSF